MNEQIKLLNDYIKIFDFNKRNLTVMDKICFSQWYHDIFLDEDIINVLYKTLNDKKINKTTKRQVLRFVINSHNGILKNTSTKFSTLGKGNYSRKFKFIFSW